MKLTRIHYLVFALLLFIQLNNTNAQQLENLGKNINSDISEVGPIISPDGNTLYFVKSKKVSGNFIQEAWYSTKDNSGNWSPSKKMNEPFGKFEVNCVMSITPDGNKILLYQGNNDIKDNNNGLYFSDKKSTGWSKPEKVNIINYKKYLTNSIYHGAFLTNSGKVLIIYFAKSEDDYFCSLYVCFLNNDDSWSEPKILPNNINVNEGKYGNWGSSIASDDITLYFSSDRDNGYGNCDIYVTRRLDDSWLKWSQPENLGKSINSSSFDGYYSISAKGDYAYLISSSDGYGAEDIFRIKLPEKVRPNPVVLISGKVLNPKNNQPLDAAIAYYTLPEGVEAGIARTNPSDGSYKIVLPYGKQYSFIATVDGYYSISNYLDLTTISEYREMNFNVDMKPIEIGEVVRLNNIFFDFNKSTLRPESFQELDRVVKLLNENPKIEIEISGHTDNVGTDEYNLNLSNERASSVVAYIVSKGISQSRITAKGYGKTNPVATNDTEEGRQLNRRVEFKILKK
ncbi:MAG TPA: OmpA family protein [Ignavibacteria bacterium]